LHTSAREKRVQVKVSDDHQASMSTAKIIDGSGKGGMPSVAKTTADPLFNAYCLGLMIPSHPLNWSLQRITGVGVVFVDRIMIVT